MVDIFTVWQVSGSVVASRNGRKGNAVSPVLDKHFIYRFPEGRGAKPRKLPGSNSCSMNSKKIIQWSSSDKSAPITSEEQKSQISKYKKYNGISSSFCYWVEHLNGVWPCTCSGHAPNNSILEFFIKIIWTDGIPTAPAFIIITVRMTNKMPQNCVRNATAIMAEEANRKLKPNENNRKLNGNMRHISI